MQAVELLRKSDKPFAAGKLLAMVKKTNIRSLCTIYFPCSIYNFSL